MRSFKLRVLSGLSCVLMAAVSLHALAAGGITGKWKGSMGMGNKYDQTLELTLQDANGKVSGIGRQCSASGNCGDLKVKGEYFTRNGEVHLFVTYTESGNFNIFGTLGGDHLGGMARGGEFGEAKINLTRQ